MLVWTRFDGYILFIGQATNKHEGASSWSITPYPATWVFVRSFLSFFRLRSAKH